MALTIGLTELPTPLLEFGGPGQFTNPKVGLQEAGPFDLRFGAAHRSELRIGLVGPADSVDRARRWIDRCSAPIAARVSGSLVDPDFPGFASAFHCKIVHDRRLTATFKSSPDELAIALDLTDKKKRFERVLELYANGVQRLSDSETTRPDVVICCLSDEVRTKCWSIQNEFSKQGKVALKTMQKNQTQLAFEFGGTDSIEETVEDLLFRDFRRALKARAMSARMPIQIGTDRLFVDSDKSQPASTRAWNSCVALYYKAGGIPWRLHLDGPETCFVGIAFNHFQTSERHIVKSSLAQAFSTEGEGFALRGEIVPWDKSQGRNVHLGEEQAFRLGDAILHEYHERTGGAPLRVVLHKTSWYNEEESAGFQRAFRDIPVLELIHLMPNTDFRLVRFGDYPPKRGTLCVVNDAAYLFTTGFTPELNTYPGPHIPTPTRILASGLDLHRAAGDLLGLTRMNWNTASITTGVPVTLSFARLVGGIIAEYGERPSLPSSFRYYI